MKTYKQVFVVLAISIFIVPQIAFAAWWNPISWSVWNIFRPTPKIQQIEGTATISAPPIATTTKKAGRESNVKTSEESNKQKLKNIPTPTKPQKSTTSNTSTGNATTGQLSAKGDTKNETAAVLVVSDIKPYDIPVGVPFIMTVYGAVFQNNADVELNGFPLGHFTLTSQGTLEKSMTITDSRVFDVAGQSSFKVVNPNGVSGIKEMMIFHHDATPKPQIQCSPTYPTPQNLMITDVAPPHINFSALTYSWKTTKYFATTTNNLSFALYGSISLWSNELVTDIQNCSRMNLIMQSGSAASIEYFVDGASIGKPSSVGLGDYQMPFDTKKYTNGEHSLSITATDADGHTASASTQIYIEN